MRLASTTRTIRTLLVAVAACAALHVPAATAQQFTLKYGHVDTPSDRADDHVSGLFLKAFLEGSGAPEPSGQRKGFWF